MKPKNEVQCSKRNVSKNIRITHNKNREDEKMFKPCRNQTAFRVPRVPSSQQIGALTRYNLYDWFSSKRTRVVDKLNNMNNNCEPNDSKPYSYS